MAKAPLQPKSELEVVQAVLRHEPFTLSHIEAMQAYRWGLATAKALERRRRRQRKRPTK